jgi:hypothetical protein
MDDTAAKRSLIDEELKKLLQANQRVIAAEATAINLLALQNLPALQEIQAAAAGFARMAFEVKQAIETYAEPIASFFDAMRTAQIRVGQWLIDHREQIDQMTQALPRIQRALQSSGEIGHLGWTVTEDMGLPVILHLSECADKEAANAYMLVYYEETDAMLEGVEQRLKRIECLSSFSTGLEQSFVAFRNEQYALVIPFLVSLLEHALRQLDAPRPFPSTDMAKTIRKRYKEIGDSAEVAFAMKSVVSFTEDHYQQYNAQFSDKVGIRRKGIMHGLQVPPNDRVEAIRLYHVIDTVVSLYEPMALLQ